MPTYDYKCTACGHRFELFQQMTAPSKKTCPKCHAKKAQRLIGGGGGIIFKGSGFYQTDYKKSSKPSETKPSEKPSEKSKSSDASSCKPSGCDKPACPKPAKSDG